MHLLLNFPTLNVGRRSDAGLSSGRLPFRTLSGLGPLHGYTRIVHSGNIPRKADLAGSVAIAAVCGLGPRVGIPCAGVSVGSVLQA